MNDINITPQLCSLKLTEGSVAYQVSGAGPLVVCVPGMGDLRSSFRFLEPQLVHAGYRVAVMDLRGHGDSDTTFSEYGDEATATDVTALIDELGGPAVIVGNSMGAGAGVLVAAEHPSLVSGLVLLGAFIREPKVSRATIAMMRVACYRLWVRPVWKAYLPKLYAGAKPADFAEYRDEVDAAMKRPGHTRAFWRTTHLHHDGPGRAVSAVSAPALVIMGDRDPDFPDPKAEGEWIRDALKAELVMAPDCGHYPQSQQPEVTGDATLAFLARTAPVA